MIQASKFVCLIVKYIYGLAPNYLCNVVIMHVDINGYDMPCIIKDNGNWSIRYMANNLWKNAY